MVMYVMVEAVLVKDSDCISMWTLESQKEWCNRIKIYYREQERTEKTPQKLKNWSISLTTDIRMNDEREDDLLAFYYLSISISPERPRLGALASPGWEFGYRLRILIKAFLFNWLFLLLSHSVVSNSLWPHGLQYSRLPCLHYLPVFTQTHVHWVSDAIQPSHPLLSPSSLVFNLSQPQGLFQWVISSYHVAKVLELQLPHTSFQWVIQGWFPLGLTDLITLLSKGLSRVFQHHSSKASVLQRSAFFMTQLSRPYITTEKKT